MNGLGVRIEFPPALMTREIAAFYISASLRELDLLRETNEVTPVGKGKRVRYRKDDLDAYIKNLPERASSRGQR